MANYLLIFFMIFSLPLASIATTFGKVSVKELTVRDKLAANVDCGGFELYNASVGTSNSLISQSYADNSYMEKNASLGDLSNVNVANPTTNDRLAWNGSNWVAVADGQSLSFSISSFKLNGSSSITTLIGAGSYLAVGSGTFTCSYSNGSPSSAYISSSALSTTFNLSSPFTSYTNTEALPYSSPGSHVTYTLHAGGLSKNLYTFFNNYIYIGVAAEGTDYSSFDFSTSTHVVLTNDNTKVWSSVNAGSGQDIFFASPTRLGTVTFWVGGFEGGFEAPLTETITNSKGYSESYYVWVSSNSGLGETVVETK